MPRFDLLAQLDRAPNGMTLGELLQRMMVSNGNVTGLVERLTSRASWTAARRRPIGERRSCSLTVDGRRAFRAMARAHADWIGEMFGELSAAEIDDTDEACPASQGAPRTRPANESDYIANPVTLPLSGYKAQHVRLPRRRQSRDDDAEPP